MAIVDTNELVSIDTAFNDTSKRLANTVPNMEACGLAYSCICTANSAHESNYCCVNLIIVA